MYTRVSVTCGMMKNVWSSVTMRLPSGDSAGVGPDVVLRGAGENARGLTETPRGRAYAAFFALTAGLASTF
jgi:hypothetical protein